MQYFWFIFHHFLFDFIETDSSYVTDMPFIFKDAGEGEQDGIAGEPALDADAAEAEVEVAAAAGDPVVAPGEAAADEANWNPIEWDRAAEDLTWERLLGLDGSLVGFSFSFLLFFWGGGGKVNPL